VVLGVILTCGAAGPARADFPYDLSFTPTGNGALDAAIESASQLSALKDRTPDSEAALRSRADGDRDRLNIVARAFGYYDDTVDVKIDDSVTPAKVTVTVTPGPQYTLSSVTIVGPNGAALPEDAPTIDPAAIGLKIGQPALAAPVAAGDDKVAHVFREKTFPFAQVTQRRVVVDHGTHEMQVTYTVDPGPTGVFGPTTVKGLEDVHKDYVERRFLWTEGEPYDVTKVEKTRDALIASNLFGLVTITPQKPAETDASPPVPVPMDVDVTERPKHSIAAGASYASTEGVSFNASWEDRNLWGEGEDLKAGLLFGQEDKAATLDFRRPDMLGVGWDLVSKLTVNKENATAYVSKGERLFGGFEYKGFHDIVIGFGLALEHANISDYELQQRYFLVGIPVYAKRDASNDLLNPTTGDREGLTLTPYTDPFRSGLSFVSGRLNGSYYLKLGDTDTYVLAMMGALGATVGVGLNALPKDKRFYVGGGGSVRGYAFQRVGPLDSHDTPVGGLSSSEASLELRYKLTQSIGLVPFLDAGNVYDTRFPDLSRRLFLGAGFGVRYYTALGPVRLDLATPLERREGDRPIQIYVSLGQAF
jgi:translocation and assembly module TamA